MDPVWVEFGLDHPGLFGSRPSQEKFAIPKHNRKRQIQTLKISMMEDYMKTMDMA